MLRLIAAVLFALMFLVEIVQASGLVRALATPVPVAERLGISTGAEILRAGILLVLALAVAVGALLAVIGLLGRLRALFLGGALACAAGYLLQGTFQVATGALHLGSGRVVLVGVIYLILAALAYAMRGSALAS